MPDDETTEGDLLSAEESRRYMQRIQAEIAVDAERRRRTDPDLARAERDIERAWASVAPPGAAGKSEELLLDRVDRLSLIDVDAPLGARPGVRHVKGAIRKGTYWYLRYMSDQLNALHGVQTRLLHRLDDRLARVERSMGLSSVVDGLLGPPAAPGEAVGRAATAALAAAPGPVLVMSCGGGGCVAALTEAGIAVHGVEADPDVVMAAIDKGLDVRAGSPAEYLSAVPPHSLGGIVLGGFIERISIAEILDVIGSARRALAAGGMLIVAADDPLARPQVQRELLAGRGLSPAAWGTVFEGQGETIEFIPLPDDSDALLLVVRIS